MHACKSVWWTCGVLFGLEVTCHFIPTYSIDTDSWTGNCGFNFILQLQANVLWFFYAVNSRQKARCSMPDSYSFSILCWKIKSCHLLVYEPHGAYRKSLHCSTVIYVKIKEMSYTFFLSYKTIEDLWQKIVK